MNYRGILKQEFDSRKYLNSSYSLRAFARDLDISASNLCNIFSGKKGISVEKSQKVATKIGLIGNEKDLFVALVEKEHARRKVLRLKAEKYLKVALKYNQIDNFSFDLISDWYYFAILATMDLDSFDGSSIFISNYLSLSESVVKDALSLLLKLKLIESRKGLYVLLSSNIKTDTDFPSLALRKSHKQSMRQAIESLDKYEADKRDITSMTMAIDIDKIPEAKRRITKFRRELCEFLESGKKDGVYNLNIQFHPLEGKENIQ